MAHVGHVPIATGLDRNQSVAMIVDQLLQDRDGFFPLPFIEQVSRRLHRFDGLRVQVERYRFSKERVAAQPLSSHRHGRCRNQHPDHRRTQSLMSESRSHRVL